MDFFVFSWVCKIVRCKTGWKLALTMWRQVMWLFDKWETIPVLFYFPPKLHPLSWSGTVSQLKLIEWRQNLLSLIFFSSLSKIAVGQSSMMHDVYGTWCIWYLFAVMPDFLSSCIYYIFVLSYSNSNGLFHVKFHYIVNKKNLYWESMMRMLIISTFFQM